MSAEENKALVRRFFEAQVEGDLHAMKVPRVRDGGYFPSLLEPRRRAERALSAVVQEAYVHGVSTRKVDELVKALGMGGISKSRVSELCEELDGEVERFRGRPLEGSYPYFWVDATYVKARQDGRVSSVAVVIAVGVKGETGEREVLGLDVGPSEDGAFWTSFLRSLVARGLRGVRLVTSDAHRGLKGAVEAVLQGASWQRCRVHFMRNALSLVPKAAQQRWWAQPSAPSLPSPTPVAPASSGAGSQRATALGSRGSRS